MRMAPSEPSAGSVQMMFGAVGGEDVLALGGDVGGHAEGDGEALRGAEHGVGDAGVAAGGVEESFAGGELAFALGVRRRWRRRRGL